MLCWYCRTHKTINCRVPNNTHSKYYNPEVPRYCNKCKCVTNHIRQTNNSLVKP